MNMRSTRSTVTFSAAITFSGFPSELPAISEDDAKDALRRMAATAHTTNHSDAALSPQEDLK